MGIEYHTSERFFITGKTGTGKTFFARYLTQTLPRLVVLDPKFTLSDWGLEEWNKETRQALREGEDVRIRVTWEEGGDSVEFWESVMWVIFECEDVVVYIDEIYSLAPQGNFNPPVMQKIYTQGRELGIGAIGASQRPRWIPGFCMTEAEHFVMFRLHKKKDRIHMSEFMGDQVIEGIPADDPHGFYYYHVKENDPEYIEILDIGRGEGWGKFELEIEEAA